MQTKPYRGTIPRTDANWHAVQTRDARAALFYGVRTMGVVCRPTCPSRRPNRENVELFATFEQAVAVGYRACKRCRPSEPRDRAVVRFALDETSLGAILVARTPRGVCAIALGDDAPTLVRDLQTRFPAAFLLHDDAALARERKLVRAFVEDPAAGLDLPLDLQGTAFQLAVWAALRDLPRGRTATYRDVACRLGRPHAVRAVASACAANPVALAVPCHRVVRADGTDSGYAWGLARKRALLAREAA
ncbi:methylated-DNA--[protein]-cysteine S-methyltransferase [Roseiterribacter gracilis]|uniref:methylated-DNA--[protein]-cysteine S-methyltransferase n=1 Tax=Roseiterribacter gracilis TaxID=2812848 RepID=A0A8S8XCP4_9PROT|nr:transcriptional regulator [Rhodospirillales bacterium TMPK1]